MGESKGEKASSRNIKMNQSLDVIMERLDPRPVQRYPPVHSNEVYTKEGPEDKHPEATFTHIGSNKSHFVVSPEWISEEYNHPKHHGRTYKPWAYEFPGARNFNGPTVKPVPAPRN